MADQWTITAADVVDTGRWLDCYAIKENGTGECDHHSFPLDILEWRAAEYGIDPRDFDTLIDVVLHEPFIPDPGDPANFRDDAAAARGYVSPAVELRRGVVPFELVPTTLVNAEARELARGAHLERVAHAKQHVGRVARPNQPGKSDPLAAVAQRYAQFVDDTEVERKRAAVDQHRARARTTAEKHAATPVSRLRARLDTDRAFQLNAMPARPSNRSL